LLLVNNQRLHEPADHIVENVVEAIEDKDAYHAHFEVPGVKKEDVKIELNNGLLTVTAPTAQQVSTVSVSVEG
jgi:HSP20 family molecular chaperone IbpA